MKVEDDLDVLLEKQWGASFKYNNKILEMIDFRPRRATVDELFKGARAKTDFDAILSIPSDAVLCGVALCYNNTFGTLWILGVLDTSRLQVVPVVFDRITEKYNPEFNKWQHVSKNWWANKLLFDKIEQWWNKQQ